MAHVGELMRHHHANLVEAVAVKQGVEQDHPLRGPQTGHIRVGSACPPAGVHAVDLPHPHPCCLGQFQHARTHLSLGQRGEVVEQRLQEDRGQGSEQSARHHRAAGGG